MSVDQEIFADNPKDGHRGNNNHKCGFSANGLASRLTSQRIITKARLTQKGSLDFTGKQTRTDLRS